MINEQSATKTLCDLISYKSIGGEDKHLNDLNACLDYIESNTKSFVDHSQRFEADGIAPIYHAQINASVDNAPTIMIYNHYDVQPADEKDWKSDPFNGTEKDGLIYGRGAQDNKGQLCVVWKAIEKAKKNNLLKYNIDWIVEGEEEIGSPNYPQLTKSLVSNADTVIVVDCDMGTFEQPIVTLGTRGVVGLKITLQTMDCCSHSGIFGGYHQNAPLILAQLLAEFNKIKDQLDGYQYKPHSEDDLNYFKSTCMSLYNDANYIKTWLEPSYDVNGLSGGYVGNTLKTIIPHEATALISLRLVPGQKPEKLIHSITSWFKENLHKDIKLTITNANVPCEASFTPRTNKHAIALQTAYTETIGKKTRFGLSGATIPIVNYICNKHDLDAVFCGFGLATDRIHSSNEHFSIRQLHTGIETIYSFLTN